MAVIDWDKERLFDAIKTVVRSGMSINDFLLYARECWIEALQQELLDAKRHWAERLNPKSGI